MGNNFKIAITMPSGENLGNGKRFKTATPKKADGGQMSPEQMPADDMTGGGMVEGPSHEEGGVPVVDQNTKEPMAEVEGQERIFSQEDTQMMEEAAAQIAQLAQQDPAGADEAAKQLGYAIVEMIMRQEQGAQEMMGNGAPAQAPNDMMAMAANQFV